jgi:hypothetical protein
MISQVSCRLMSWAKGSTSLARSAAENSRVREKQDPSRRQRCLACRFTQPDNGRFRVADPDGDPPSVGRQTAAPNGLFGDGPQAGLLGACCQAADMDNLCSLRAAARQPALAGCGAATGG